MNPYYPNPRGDAARSERRAEISAATGFDYGERFESDDQVREYFTVANILEMFGPDADTNEAELASMADDVIENRWHFAPMSTVQAAAALDITAATVRQAIGDGRLRATKRGRDWWIDPAEVVRYGRERRVV